MHYPRYCANLISRIHRRRSITKYEGDPLMNHTEAIEMMFKNLDNWRHLPKYQLERRADMFIGLFIRQIVAGHLGCKEEQIHSLVIPEFPFRYNENEKDPNHTVNFDYVLFSDDLTAMYIIELKTDPDSYRDEQNDYLEKAVDFGFTKIVAGINQVINATSKNKRGKYDCLCKLLSKADLAIYDDNRLEAIRHPDIELLYLGPFPSKKDTANKLGKKLIELKTAANILEKTGGAVECHFASYLRRWNDNPAGSTCCE
jgi:hypothetical protein